MTKIVVVALMLLGVYFIFFQDKLPSQLVFDGYTLEKKSKQLFERADGKFAVYKYADKSQKHFLVLVVSEDGSAVPDEAIKQFYIKRLKNQQNMVSVPSQQGRYLGYKRNKPRGMAQVYLTYAPTIKAVIVYTRSSSQEALNKGESEQVFLNLERYTF